MLQRLALLVVLLTAFGCRSLGPTGRGRIVDGATGASRSADELVERLVALDVVFLGELHDSDDGHALQAEITRRLGRRRPLCISLEMFERDVQIWLDAYLAGALDEDGFLAATRPWPNYAEHYRPAVELARAQGWPVLAANLPRPVAREIARRGLAAVSSPWLPRHVDTSAGAYKEHFVAAMGGHGAGMEEEQLDDWYAAQCAKDDAMAESIADWLARYARANREDGDEVPLVVHWCGRFHSDHGLGTVERLRARRPDLAIGVVTMTRPDGTPEASELAAGDWAFVVRN